MSGSSLEDRVSRLEDEQQVLKTLYQYAHTLDSGPEFEFLDCFLPGGVWERVNVRSAEPARRFEGRNELIRFYNDPKRGRAPQVYFKHLLLEPRMTFAGDEVDAISYFVRLQEHPDGPYVYAFGRYFDHLTRCADGRWRIRHRKAVTEDTRARPVER